MSEDKLSDKEFEQALLLRKLEFEVRDLESRWRASGRARSAGRAGSRPRGAN